MKIVFSVYCVNDCAAKQPQECASPKEIQDYILLFVRRHLFSLLPLTTYQSYVSLYLKFRLCWDYTRALVALIKFLNVSILFRK